MVYKIILLLIVLIFGGYQLQDTSNFEKPTLSSIEEPASARVTKVVDGDTIEVLIDGKVAVVRYIGIDTPEPYRDKTPQCFSHEATAANRQLVEGADVVLVSDLENTDVHGRLLRYVYVDGVFINKVLIQNGFARAINIKPNSTHFSEFARLEKQAQTDKKGLWGQCQ